MEYLWGEFLRGITHIINVRNFSIGRFPKRLLTGFKTVSALHSFRSEKNLLSVEKKGNFIRFFAYQHW